MGIRLPLGTVCEKYCSIKHIAEPTCLVSSRHVKNHVFSHVSFTVDFNAGCIKSVLGDKE